MLVTNTAFTYMVNHVFLPPKLPEGDDWEASHSKALQSNIMACIEKFVTYVTLGNRALMQSAASMIRRMTQAQNEHGYIHCDKLEQVLDEIGEKDLSSDMIEIMSFKVARRKHKLLAAFQGEVEEQVISFADKAMTDAARELISRQRPFVANESPDNKLRHLESVNFVNDTVYRLKNLDEFIKSISDRTMSLDKASFCPPAY
ncbi:uncharacterized protein PpBr36_10409, partial [Pyricularia pennisetigena]|uniref:uncharacterized protein n=1 Tax=Pyricularia pennisetigena TaxID=1578925 RepID=UPI0011533245